MLGSNCGLPARRPGVGNLPGQQCDPSRISDGAAATFAVGATVANVTVTPQVDTEYDSLQLNSDIRGSVAFRYCGKDIFTGLDVSSFAPGSENKPQFCIRARANQPVTFTVTSYAAAAGGEVVSATLTGRRGDCE